MLVIIIIYYLHTYKNKKYNCSVPKVVLYASYYYSLSTYL